MHITLFKIKAAFEHFMLAANEDVALAPFLTLVKRLEIVMGGGGYGRIGLSGQSVVHFVESPGCAFLHSPPNLGFTGET